MDSLKKLTSPFILRRPKKTAAPDLPKKTESVLWCEMEDEQRSAYEDIMNQVRDNIMVEIKDTIEEKIMALQEKKQILSDEVVADDGNFLKNLTADDIAFLFE